MTETLYVVDVHADGRLVARWERFGASVAAVLASTRDAAEREWPGRDIAVGLSPAQPTDRRPS